MGIFDAENELDDELHPRIGRPGGGLGIPPVALRGVGSSVPPQPAPKLESVSQPRPDLPLEQPAPTPTPGQQRIDKDQAELGRLDSTGSGISQIKNPWARNSLRGLNILGGTVAPGLMSRLPGTEEHHNQLVNRQQGRLNEDLGVQQKEATTAGQQATTEHTQAETNAIENPEAKPKEEEWTPYQYFTGPNGEPLEIEKSSGTVRLVGGGVPTGFKPAKVAPDKPDSIDQQYQDALQSGDHAKAERLLQVKTDLARAGQAPQRDQRQLAVIDGKVVELRPGMAVPEGTKSLTGELAGAKPTADEQRRADLAGNLKENLAALEDIVKRKPNLFGPMAGRLTGLRSTVGTSDPDIAALETIKHQIGMAQISAHGMRSAHGIDAAAESILNSFHNQPEAILGAIEAARNSVGTFEKDAAEPGHAQHAAQPGGAKKHNDPLGIR